MLGGNKLNKCREKPFRRLRGADCESVWFVRRRVCPGGYFREREKLMLEKSSVNTRTNRSILITGKFRLKIERSEECQKVQEGLGGTPHESQVCKETHLL